MSWNSKATGLGGCRARQAVYLDNLRTMAIIVSFASKKGLSIYNKYLHLIEYWRKNLMANPLKKISKLQYKANQLKARAEMYRNQNKHKKAGKFQGKADHIELKISKLRLKHNVPAPQQYSEEKATPVTQPVTQREIIQREVVKIPCNFCGTLNEVTEKRCSGCGASIGS